MSHIVVVLIGTGVSVVVTVIISIVITNRRTAAIIKKTDTGQLEAAAEEIDLLKELSEKMDHSDRQMRAAWQELHDLVENAPYIMLRLDADNRVVYANSALRREMGISPSDIIGKSCREGGMTDSVCTELDRASRRARSSGYPYEVDVVIPAEPFDRHYNCVLVPEDGGTVLVVARECTQSRRLMTELRQAREIAEATLDIVEVVVVALNADGNIILLNRKGCSLLRKERCPSSVIGLNWFENFVAKDDRRTAHARFKAMVNGHTRDVVQDSYRIVDADSEEILVNWSHGAIKSEGIVVMVLSSGKEA